MKLCIHCKNAASLSATIEASDFVCGRSRADIALLQLAVEAVHHDPEVDTEP